MILGNGGLSGGALLGGVLAVLVAGNDPGTAQEARWHCPDPASLLAGTDGAMAHVRYLSDDLLEGRAVATRGERCAGDYIADQFRSLGLKPAGDDAGYFQAWEVRTGTELAPGNHLTLVAPGGDEAELALGSDWRPYGFSASTRVRADLALAPPDARGQGGDPAHAALGGQILVVEAGPDASHLATEDMHRIGARAASMGAVGVIALLGDGGAGLPRLDGERRSALEIPVVAVSDARRQEVIRGAEQGWGVVLNTALRAVRREARNVVAVLQGTDRAGRRSLVVGAHYDHLGLGGEGSLSPSRWGEVHNGADDNASGTAVMLEVARRLSTGARLPDDVYFAAFTGEERGLWGSARYVESPPAPLESTIAMLNMDMVGRVRDDALTVFGTGTAVEWPAVLDRSNRSIASPLELQFNRDGFGASDHSSFYAKGIPALHFFSNTHPQYHRVDDDWHRINADGLDRVTKLVVAVVRDVLQPTHAASLTPVTGDPHGAPGARNAGPGGGFRVRVGTLPDYSRESGGMGITGVRDGSPAAKAGIRSGDVLIRFGPHEIDDVYGYMYALAEYEPGDEVEVVVLRDGDTLVLTVVLAGPGQ